MTITKKTVPDMILFRFDPDSLTPVIRGAAYYERTVIEEDGVFLSATDGDAQPVSIAKDVKGLDLTTILGVLAAGQQALLDEQTTVIAAHVADIAAKDSNIQALLEEKASIEAEAARLRIVVDTFASADEPVVEVAQEAN